MNLPQDYLYALLPAFIRNRDYYQGQPLRALMEVLDLEHRQLWTSVAALYDDWFIETCGEATVPAIGDLVAVGDVESVGGWNRRALVGNAVAYRRRKGVPAILERAVRDATGWYPRVVEVSRHLVMSQALEEVRPGRGGTVNLRDGKALAALGTPFETVPRLDAVRRGNLERGRTAAGRPLGPGGNLTQLAVSLWRLQAYPLTRVTARWVGRPGCYTFHPLGVDTPLFNPPRTPVRLTDPVTPRNLPEPLRPDLLSAEIEARRRGEAPATDYLGLQPAFEVFDPETGIRYPAEALQIADLSSWRRPPADGPHARRAVQVAVDPVLGRLAFPPGRGESGRVEVSFSYGFGGDLGGGPYPSATAPAEAEDPEPSAAWRAAVGGLTADGGDDGRAPLPSLAAALAAWQASGMPRGVLLVGGAAQEVAPGPLAIDLRGGRRLTIAAAEPGPGVLLGSVSVVADELPSGAALTLANLWLEGAVEAAGSLDLALHHCTVCPSAEHRAAGAALVLQGGMALTARLAGSIVGPVEYRGGAVRLRVADGIVDAGGGAAAIRTSVEPGPPGAPGAELTLDLARATVLGATACHRLLLADAALFAGPLVVAQPEEGLLSHCYAPPASRTPRRFRCQPELERARSGAAAPETAEPSRPVFVSRRYGDPAYAQLSPASPRAIRTGAESGSEVGAFETQRRPQREAALAAVLEEYTPFGIDAKVVYVT